VPAISVPFGRGPRLRGGRGALWQRGRRGELFLRRLRPGGCPPTRALIPRGASVPSCRPRGQEGDEVEDFAGAARGSFVAPEHGYPAYLELRLTATDSGGLTSTRSVRLDPTSVQLRFASRPTGARLVVGSTGTRAPFTRRVIVGSSNSVSAPSRFVPRLV